MFNPLPFYIPFLTKHGTHFVYLLQTNGAPSTYLVYNFASLLTAANALSFKQESVTEIERFLDFLKAIKFICQPFWALLQTKMTDFPTLLNTPTREIPTLT